MTVRELYDQIGGNYEDVCSRLMKEDRILKFAKMFLDDDSCPKLLEYMDQGDMENAFKAAHTLKGITANLGFEKLNLAACEITEALRNGSNVEKAKEMKPQIQELYNMMIEGLTNYKE